MIGTYKHSETTKILTFPHEEGKSFGLKAFTLAEVLIVLGIIGVVAALTIPTLLQNYQEKVTVTKVKKIYNVLAQAVKLSQVENGDIAGWDFGNDNTTTYNKDTANALWNNLKPYMKVAKDCADSTKCYINGYVKNLDGSDYTVNYNNRNEYYKVIFNDGSIMWFRTNKGSGKCTQSNSGIDNICAYFWYDTDGNKGSNTFGKDIFVFYMTTTGIVPHNGICDKASGSGWGCAKYIINNGNMKYLHE